MTIQNPYGNVSITAWDRDAVLVEAIKHTSDPRHTDDARIVVDPSPDSLSIRTQYTGADAEHPTSVEYRLTVPRHAHLEGVLLTNGQLSLAGLAGPVQAQSINGDIHALKMGGATQLSTVNGRVEANFDSTSPGHSISLSSVNGGIALTLPGGSDANLEAENRSGGIASNLGHVMRTGAGRPPGNEGRRSTHPPPQHQRRDFDSLRASVHSAGRDRSDSAQTAPATQATPAIC